MFVKIRPVRVSTIVGCFRKMPVQIFSGMFGVSALLISPVLYHYLSHLYCHMCSVDILWRKHCKFLRKLYIISTAVQKTSRIPLEKKKFTLSLNHHIQVSFWLLELFLCFQLKQSSHFCFKKEFHTKHNVRSYFEVTRVLLYIYTKNVTPGNKTLGSYLKWFRIFEKHRKILKLNVIEN